MLDAAEEKDFWKTIKTIEVFLNGTQIVVETKDSSDHKGMYFLRISAK